MKIDRLIGIITILLQKEKVTAPYLAEKFEVSRRTINRDIEDICKAGIPIVTTQGVNGGISIAEGYKIDKTVFTGEELKAIFAGLKSLNSIAQDRKYQNIIEKFSADDKGLIIDNHILIDLSSHYKSTLAPKIAEIRQAIEDSCEIEFIYYSNRGEQRVSIEPYLVVFQWSNWYLLGYREEKDEFRLFKLNRLWELQCTDRQFIPREIPDEKLDFSTYFTDEIHAVVLFDESEKYKLIEEYGRDCIKTLEDGRLKFEFQFTNSDYLQEWVLSFGEKAELLEPKALREELKTRLQKSLDKYI